MAGQNDWWQKPNNIWLKVILPKRLYVTQNSSYFELSVSMVAKKHSLPTLKIWDVP